MKKQAIITENKQIKAYIEKNRKIPKTCTFTDNKIYSIYSAAYLSGLLVNNNFKDTEYVLIDIRTYNADMPKDTINEKVLKSDYLKMINNFINFCKINHRVPSYITTVKSGTKVSFDLFIYCLAKIIVYYDNNNALPNYCLFNKSDIKNYQSNSIPSEKSEINNISTCNNRINSSKGCDAMGQNNSYYCGVCALQKVLYKFGINESQKSLANMAGTTSAGTSHQGLRTAIAYVSKKHKVKLSVKEAYFSDYTLKQIKDIVCNPKKDIILHSLYRNKYGHYEKIKSVDTSNKVFEIVNSLGDKCNLGCFCGYIEKRTYATQKSYCNGINQKSLIIVTKE